MVCKIMKFWQNNLAVAKSLKKWMLENGNGFF
jgi:hypothetical protein